MSKKSKLKPEKVKSWLSTQDSYTLHKPVKYKFPQQRVVVGGMGHQWQADLEDVSIISKYNKGHQSQYSRTIQSNVKVQTLAIFHET